jgi:hypothetical protein
MRFYTQAHTYYCGIDLHARWMYLCVLDHSLRRSACGNGQFREHIQSIGSRGRP